MDLPNQSLPEGELHFSAKVEVYETLRTYFSRGGRRVYIASELSVFYPDAPAFAPDIMAVLDVDTSLPRSRWVVSAEGKGLDFVLEVHVGGDRKKDAADKVALYASVGIPEYFIYDRQRQRLHGHRLGDNGRSYMPIIPQAGRYESASLGLELVVQDGRLRFFHVNALLMDAHEAMERLSAMVQEVEARADEEARLRAEEARLRAEEAKLRAEEESRRVEAEKRVAELLAEIDRLKGRG
jgi:Uma2 family endonuclease